MSAPCEHADRTRRVCPHVLGGDIPYYEKFTGLGIERTIVCEACRDAAPLVDVCASCAKEATDGGCEGIVGEPEIRSRETAARFVASEERPARALRVIAPFIDGDRARFVAIDGSGIVSIWDADTNELFAKATIVDDAIDPMQPLVVRVAPNGKLAAIANRRGLACAIIDLVAGTHVRRLARDGYRNENCDYSIAFVERDGRTLVIHAPAWNRLDVIDPMTGEVLTERQPTSYTRDEERPPHYLDYFHCTLEVSPDGRWLVDNGWVWAPVGIVTSWSVDAWLAGNAWESEDGPTRRKLCWRDYYWDGPLAWIDATRVAIYGYGSDDQWLIPAARIFDVTTGEEDRWFPGPSGEFYVDGGILLAHSNPKGIAAWEIATGTRIAHDPAIAVAAVYHPAAKLFVTPPAEGHTRIARLVGVDAEAPWNTPIVRELAAAIARDRSFDELSVLGDALEQAGCTDREVLDHCHAGATHHERCWLLDRLLT